MKPQQPTHLLLRGTLEWGMVSKARNNKLSYDIAYSSYLTSVNKVLALYLWLAKERHDAGPRRPLDKWIDAGREILW